jgi:acetylornithine deacetylase/succinyl-diaminopimelate desuccinylase-like protein
VRERETGASPVLDVVDRIERAVDERFDLYLERIRSLCRMPSVSATGEGVREVAEAVRALVEEAGGSARLVETPGHPVVLGEITGPPAAPTLVRYGMYDVQPAEEPDWTAPPFAAEIVELPDLGDAGPVVLGRGTANSKGSLSAFFCALDVLRRTGGVPVGLRFVVEGEEELGSPHLEDVVRRHADELRGDGGVDFDLYGDRGGKSAELVLGCKGLLGLELRCEGGEWGGPVRPLHSSEVALIASPVWRLTRALASLVDGDEEPSVPGLLQRLRGPSAADRELLVELAEAFDPAEHLEEAGAARFRVRGDPVQLLEALLYRPTVNVSGIEAGYTGPASKTIIPSAARANVDIRLVPDLDPDDAARSVREHLDAGGFDAVQMRVTDRYPWAKADPRSAVASAFRRSYGALGVRTQPYPLAPWCAPFHVFDRVLGIPWASGGLGYSGGAHGPDEFASVQGLRTHIAGVAAFLVAYAAGASGGEPA